MEAGFSVLYNINKSKVCNGLKRFWLELYRLLKSSSTLKYVVVKFLLLEMPRTKVGHLLNFIFIFHNLAKYDTHLV